MLHQLVFSCFRKGLVARHFTALTCRYGTPQCFLLGFMKSFDVSLQVSPATKAHIATRGLAASEYISVSTLYVTDGLWRKAWFGRGV